jgi:predicted ATPase
VIRTPDQRLRVFVSSTLQELADERVAAQEAITSLRLVPVLFELGARPHPPRDLYRAYLEQSHVFIGLYWQRYGWVAPDMDISGLEDEAILAAQHPKLVYIKMPAPEREPRLTALIDRIRDDNTTSYRQFSTHHELRELIENDLAILLSERFESVDHHEAPPEQLRPVLVESLPSPPSSIIGRELELTTLSELIQRSDTRLVTITGPGGSGKTRLSVEVAAHLRDLVGWKVCFIDLTGVRSSSLVLSTIAGALGIRDLGDSSLLDAITSVMQDRAALLVIDNFEHLIDAAGDLSDILSVTTNLKMLVTSRQPLRLRWEQEYPLFPLAVPEPDGPASLDAVGASPSVELLLERARRVQPSLSLTNDNVDAIAGIARQLEGLPLAIELAAARLRVLSPSDLLARLERRLDALAGTSPDMPDRHRTLREAISWSHGLLSAEEQKIFRRLGVFAGGAGLEAVEAVCSGDDIDSMLVLDLLSSLVDKSLVVSGGDLGLGQTRFFMLETIREFAVEQLVAAGEAELTWDRHLAFHVALAEQAFDGFWSSDMQRWLDIVGRELDNLRTALDHAAGIGDAVLGLRIGYSLWPFWDVRGHYREGEQRLRQLLDEAPDESSLARGQALSALGWLIALTGDFEQAMTLMDQGLPMVRAHGTKLQLARALVEQGNVAFSLGQADEAGQLFGESADLARELDDTFLIGFGLFGLAYTAFLEGDVATMETRLHDSLALTRIVYQPWGIAWAQISLGLVAILNGDIKAAIPRITESLELRWAIRDVRGLPESLQLLATVSSADGDMEWAARLHGAAELQREANGLTVLPFLRPLHDESVARLRDALGQAQLDELWAVGRATPLEKIVNEALGRRID